MTIIQKIIYCYWNVCRLKESPENTPYSFLLFTIGGLVLAIVMTFQWSLSEFGFSEDLLVIFVAGLSLSFSFVLYTAVILFFKGLKERLVQTATCLLYVHTIIHLLAMPLFFLDPYLTHANLKNPFFLFIGVLYLFITLGLSVWQFVITAHIYKYALNTTPTQSVLAAFGLLAVNILTVSFWR